MEFPRRAIILERGLAALAIAACFSAARIEARSSLAAHVREERSWPAWVEAREKGKISPLPPQLLVYDPISRRMTVLHIPNVSKPDVRDSIERTTLEALHNTDDSISRLTVDIPALDGEDEACLETAEAFKARSRDPRAWLRLARQALRGDSAALDRLFLGLELRQVPIENLEPVRLSDAAQTPDALTRFIENNLNPENRGAPTVEVLNGTSDAGLASRAAKMLRLRNVDVLALGTARRRARTIVYDRTGNFKRAAGLLAALGCSTARAVTRLDSSRVVDVSVELGGDCASAFGREP